MCFFHPNRGQTEPTPQLKQPDKIGEDRHLRTLAQSILETHFAVMRAHGAAGKIWHPCLYDGRESLGVYFLICCLRVLRLRRIRGRWWSRLSFCGEVFRIVLLLLILQSRMMAPRQVWVIVKFRTNQQWHFDIICRTVNHAHAANCVARVGHGRHRLHFRGINIKMKRAYLKRSP